VLHAALGSQNVTSELEANQRFKDVVLAAKSFLEDGISLFSNKLTDLIINQDDTNTINVTSHVLEMERIQASITQLNEDIKTIHIALAKLEIITQLLQPTIEIENERFNMPHFTWLYNIEKFGTNGWDVNEESGHCIRIHESEFTQDNFLCVNSPYNMRGWKWAVNHQGKGNINCVNWNEPSSKSWADNWLCFPPNNRYYYRWSYNGNLTDSRTKCTAIYATGVAGWDDNYFCVTLT